MNDGLLILAPTVTALNSFAFGITEQSTRVHCFEVMLRVRGACGGAPLRVKATARGRLGGASPHQLQPQSSGGSAPAQCIQGLGGDRC